MRGLSLLPPWGFFMVSGEKKIETRGWAPSSPVLRSGEWLAIHHSRKWDPDTLTDLFNERDLAPEYRSETSVAFFDALTRHGRCLTDVPLGAILGACRFKQATRTDLIREMPETYFTTPHERLMGNYGPKRWGWIFDASFRLPEPIPARGAQGLWLVEADHEDAINAALREAGFDAPEVDRSRSNLAPQQGRLL